MTGWLFLAALVVICTAVIFAADRWIDRRPVFYRGRHRWPSTRHPAYRRARYLHMQRAIEAQVEEDDEVIAAMEAMLEEEDHR